MNHSPPALGLVCITSSDEVRYRTITRKRLLQQPEAEQQRMLAELYADNLRRLCTAVEFCARHGIRLYRVPSDLFPFADEAIGREVLTRMNEALASAGQLIVERGLRLVAHPDQFVVLNSDSPTVIENSIKILNMHARTMDLLGQPRSAWAVLEIHGGKGGRAERLVETIHRLPDAVRSRLALENDERAYSAAEILAICQAADVPMVFDAHHHIVKEKLESYEHPSIAEMVAAARVTWPHPEWQLVHISNGREFFGDPRHNDFIEVMPGAYRDVPWIEVEAKLKEQAIARLQQEWVAGE